MKGQKLTAQDCYGNNQHALKGEEALSSGSLWTQAARPEGAEALSQGLLWKQAARPEGAEALSPGQRPGYNDNQQCAL